MLKRAAWKMGRTPVMENCRVWRGGISSEDSPLMGIVEQHLVAFGDLSVTLRSRVSIHLWRLNTDVRWEVA